MQGELVVAGVFVRVYNEQPTFPVSDAPAFCKGLVSYLHAQTQSRQFRAAQTGAHESVDEGVQHPERLPNKLQCGSPRSTSHCQKHRLKPCS